MLRAFVLLHEKCCLNSILFVFISFAFQTAYAQNATDRGVLKIYSRHIAHDNTLDRCSNTFSKPIFLSYNFEHGCLEHNTKDGLVVKQLEILADSAESLHLFFEVNKWPKDAILEVLNPQDSAQCWRYTANDIAANGQLMTFPIAGRRLWLRLLQKNNESTDLKIFRVDLGFKNLPKLFAELRGVAGFGDAASCNKNVNCAPYSVDYALAKRSTALMMTSSLAGSGFCTGALINNSQQNKKQLFLTANHCSFGATEGSFVPWLFLFNYEALGCTSPPTDPYAPTSDKITGATVRVVNAATDVMLLELSTTIPSAFQVVYSGWTRTDKRPAQAVLIHHAQGDLKKISVSDNQISSSVFGGEAHSGESHWRTAWAEGITEGASSGAPFIDSENKIRGWLEGGTSSCTVASQPDYMRKLSKAWSFLQPWLAPCNPDIQSIDALDPAFVPTSEPHTGRFNGTSDVILDPSSSSLTKNISIEGWVNPEILTDTQTVFSWGSEAFEAATMRVLPSGFVEYAEFSGGLWRSVISSKRIRTWKWAHLAVVKIEKTAQIFIDGQADNSALLDTLTGALTTAHIGAEMRADGSFKHFFKGLIDELRVWKAIRTEAQIRAAMHEHLVPPIWGMVRLWRADEGAGLHVADLTDNSAGATLPRADMWIDLAPVSVSINGKDSLCASETSSYKAILEGCEPIRTDARLVFDWTVSNGIIIAGQGTDSVVVQWGVGGEGRLALRARHSNHFLTAQASTFWVYLATPPTLPPILAQGSLPIACGDSAKLFVNLPATAYHIKNIAFANLALTSPTLLVVPDSQWTSPLPIGFNFSVFGQTYNQLRVGADGLVNLGTAPLPLFLPAPSTLPTSLWPNTLLALAWNRLKPSHAGSIAYEVQGVAPFRQFLLQYDNVPLAEDLSKRIKAVLVLHESTNVLEFHLENIPNSSFQTTLGIQKENSTLFAAPASRNATIWPHIHHESWAFVPINSGFTWLDSGSPVLVRSVYDFQEGNFQYKYHEDKFCEDSSAVFFLPTDCFKPPVIDFPTFTTIADYSAVLGANVLSDKGLPILEKGIVWSTSTLPTVSSGTKVVVVPAGLGIFTTLISGLPPATLIHFRGFARNAAGISYTANQTFSTLPDTSPPAILSLSPTDNALEVSALTGFSISFDEKIQTSGSCSFQLYTGGGVLVEVFDVSSISGLETLNFSLSDTLLPFTSYYLLFDAGCITDLHGNTLPALSTTAWNFTTGALPLPPAVGIPPLPRPEYLTAKALSTSSIMLKWQDKASDEEGYRIFRRAEGVLVFTKIADLDALSGTCNYTDNSLVSNSAYIYYVEAYKATETATSNLAAETTFPDSPTILPIETVCSGQTAFLRVQGSTKAYKWYSNTGMALSMGGIPDSLFLLENLTKDSLVFVRALGKKYESVAVSASARVKILPEASILTDAVFRTCAAELLLEAAPVDGATYIWFRNDAFVFESTSPVLRINQSGSYSLKTVLNGCTATSVSKVFNLNYKPEAVILGSKNPADTLYLCEGQSIFAKNVKEGVYSWYKAGFLVANGIELPVPESGSYVLRVEQYGCVAYDTAFVICSNFPAVIRLETARSELCKGETGLLSCSFAKEASYTWYRNSKKIAETKLNELDVREAGIYEVELVLASSCKKRSRALSIRLNDPKLKLIQQSEFLHLRGADSIQIEQVKWFWNEEEQLLWASQHVIRPERSGKYAAFVKFKNGCEALFELKDVRILGMDGAKDLVGVFPNPTEGILNVHFSGQYAGVLDFELCDILGRSLLKKTVSIAQDDKIVLDISAFAKGVYSLKIRDNKWHKVVQIQLK